SGQGRGQLGPADVGRGDAVDQQQRRHRPVGRAVGLPHTDVEVPAADGYSDRAVARPQDGRDGRGERDRPAHWAVHPPSIVYDAPVTIAASSETRNATSPATSSGSINRRT